MQVQRLSWQAGLMGLTIFAIAGLAMPARVLAQTTDPIGTAIGLKKPSQTSPSQKPPSSGQPEQAGDKKETPTEPQPGETAEQLAERIRRQRELDAIELKPLPPVFPIVLPEQVRPVEQAAQVTTPAVERSVTAGALQAPRVWAEVRDFTPGNLAIHDARVYVTAHPFGQSAIKVYRSVQRGGYAEGFEPFTRGPWAQSLDAQGQGIGSIIGVKVEGDDLWLLDAGSQANPPKLIQWNLKTDTLTRVVHIPPPVGNAKSFLQDLAIDAARGKIYIADCGIGQGFDDATPALVVVDLKTGVSRRVLEGHASVQAEPEAKMIINGREVTSLRPDGSSVIPKVGVNPIVIDREYKWVYYGAMHGTKIYRIKAEDLADESLTAEQIARRVDVHGSKPVSDGMAIDIAGNIFITDVNASAIGVLTTKGAYRIVAQSDELLAWPDGLAIAQGQLYATVNQLHLHAPLNAGKAEQKAPFFIIQVTDQGTMRAILQESGQVTP